MTADITPTLSEKSELNPYVSGLTSRLIRSATNVELPMDSTGWQLISEVLSYAASAEQRMAEQQERIHHLEEMCVTDELTGLTNRRGLKRALGRILAHSARNQQQGVIAFLDIDDFKSVNDTYGHDAGDRYLRHVAYLLKNYVRPQDLIARIAGDEFAIVLTECNPDHGRDRVKTIQKSLNGETFDFGGHQINIACSIGLKAFDGNSDPSQVIHEADLAMYRDKKSRKSEHQMGK